MALFTYGGMLQVEAEGAVLDTAARHGGVRRHEPDAAHPVFAWAPALVDTATPPGVARCAWQLEQVGAVLDLD